MTDGLSGPLQEASGGQPRPRHAPPLQLKAAGCSAAGAGAAEGSPVAGAHSRELRGLQPPLRGKMLRERTVRLQYGSRVEAVYVLGTQLWTDVYR